MIKFSDLGKVKALTLTCIAFVSVSFISCGGDDDEGASANGSDNAGIITTSDGEKKLLTAVGGTRFEYDENDKLTGISEQYGNEYEVSYNPFTITCNGTYSYDTQSITISDISINGKGYITSLKEVSLYQSDDVKEEETTTLSLSYDGSGHITSISGNTVYKYSDSEETGTEKASGSYKFTWSSGKLVKISGTSSESDGSKYKVTVDFEYGDNEYPNLSHQFTDSMLGDALDDNGWLAYLGYIGIGGDYLPTSSYREWEDKYDDEEESGSNTYTYSYSFNSDGTISSESYKYNSSKSWITTQYSYIGMESRTSSSTIMSSDKASTKARGGLSRLFIHKKH